MRTVAMLSRNITGVILEHDLASDIHEYARVVDVAEVGHLNRVKSEIFQAQL